MIPLTRSSAERTVPRITPRPDPSTVRLPGPWTHRDVSANGIRLHVAELGTGPLVLLLHGFPEFWWSWRDQLTALADAGYRAVAVDLRGYGDSDKPPRGYDGWTLAGDAAGLIKALGERGAHLVGHGWGGLIAWTVGAMHPRLVRSVTAVSAPHPLALRREIRRGLVRRRDSQTRAVGQLFGAQLPIRPERALVADDAARVEALMRAWSGPEWPHTRGFAEAAAANRAAMRVPGVAHSALEYFRWAVRSQVRTDGRRYADAMSTPLELPVLQLHGGADPYFLPRTALASRTWAGPHARLHELPGTGHFPHQEAPSEVSAALLEFLRD